MRENTKHPREIQSGTNDGACYEHATTLSRNVQSEFRPALHRAVSDPPAYLDFAVGALYGGDAYPGATNGRDSTVFNTDKHDGRTPPGKLQQFMSAAANNAIKPENYKHYIRSEVDKLTGVAEGMNLAKEETKELVATSWKALTDGSVAIFLSKPNAVNEPLFSTVVNALNAMSKDAQAVNKAIENDVHKLAIAAAQGNSYYNKLPDREKGRVIGNAAFALLNPEASTKSGEAALKITDTVATHVDAALMKTVGAIKEVAPDVAKDIKNSVGEYIREQVLNVPQLETVGGPRGFLKGIRHTHENGGTFFSMSKADEGEGIAKNRPYEGCDIRYHIDDATQRLQRTDLGKLRQPYKWPVLNEEFAANVVRQTRESSCISAVGEMLTEGRITEQELIAKIGAPSDIDLLPAALGPEWTTKKGPQTLAEIGKHGPWAAEMLESHWTRFTKEPHVVVVDGRSPAGNVLIRDPLEGTRYEMVVKDFFKTWSGRCAYRSLD